MESFCVPDTPAWSVPRRPASGSRCGAPVLGSCRSEDCPRCASGGGFPFRRQVLAPGAEYETGRRAASSMHAGVSCRVLLGREELAEDRRCLLPIARFLLQLPPARARQLVELGLAVVLRNTPLGHNRAFLLQLEQRGIKRSVIQGKKVSAGLLNPASDPVAVLRPHCLQGLLLRSNMYSGTVLMVKQ